VNGTDQHPFSRRKIDATVSIAVSFIDVRGPPSVSGPQNEPHVRTAATSGEQQRGDLESVRVGTRSGAQVAKIAL
jgi:hypothetical protein